ncbi:M23 family metallopeptidase [Gramella lutea]|uniref:M23 family metallopeptidase n=1 Tax=Christiangramia lutea TaxID=1607951 RepID=A0A9X1V0T2_9FLAO|nr:peptidoglycan DD-metalloendopeptidase family protein [Christiangramia lutea]MCH4822197.1 M23 family metallopeptidase [Christiangramia lutea]
MQLYRALFLSILILLTSCSQMKKAENFISGLSQKEKYKQDHNIPDEIYNLWEDRVEVALDDSLEIELPYQEVGEFKPRNFAIYSYQTYLIPGEVLKAEIVTDSTHTKVFQELYKQNSDGFKKIKSGNAEGEKLSFEIEEKGLYKIIFQPEIEAHTRFSIRIFKSPGYSFPVLNGKNADIGSYWGDIRDGGRRNHEGIDIFAERGTPVIAATSGRIRFTGVKGLGGKQVWLRDVKRRQSLYYAHLDSIKPDLNSVDRGDTLGFVGNTGNAKTTPPHLHFGIYKSGRGALDPIGYVYLPDNEKDFSLDNEKITSRLEITTSKANFRNKPATNNSRIVRTGLKGELVMVLGKSNSWYHVRDGLNRSMFIHESLVKPVG